MIKCLCCMREYNESETNCPHCGNSETFKDRQKILMPDALPVGTMLTDRFVVGRVLSCTDFSIIYLAWDLLLYRKVAVREYFPVFSSKREEEKTQVVSLSSETEELFKKGKKAFLEESLNLSKNQDIKEITHIYRCIEENGTAYAIMEYMEIETLQDYFDEHRQMDAAFIDTLFKKLCSILEQCRERELLHGHISPSCIGIGEDNRIILFDFGIAKREAVLMSGGKLVTEDFSYTAPEYSLEDPLTEGADIFSLGAVYYRLLSGKDPSPSLLKKRGMGLEPGKRSYEDLLRGMLHPDPSQRVHAMEKAEMP